MICQRILKKSSMKPKSLKCNSYTRNITVEGRILCFLESRKMMRRSTPKERRRIITWRIQEVIYNFLQKELGFENAPSRFEFQRIHRVGKRSGKKPRPIIARFLRYSDREEVLLRAKTSLKGKDCGVFEDMPKELYQLRKAQMKKLQNAKHNGSTAFFSREYPDKLFIDGNYVPQN